MAASLRRAGWQHPILVRRHPVIARHYEIVAGELPYQAARSAGLAEVSIVVCKLSDIRALECVLLEDVRRPDLTPFEVAVGYGQLIRTFKYSLARLARLVGKSEQQVIRTLLLLDSPDAAREARTLRDGARDTARPDGHAEDPGTSDPLDTDPSNDAQAPQNRPALKTQVAALERHLSRVLGLEVELTAEGGDGSVRIDYAGLEQFERLVRHLSAIEGHAEPEPTRPGLAA